MNECVNLPGNRRELLVQGLDRADWLKQFALATKNNPGDYFSLLVGQPPHIRAEFEEAMGLEPA